MEPKKALSYFKVYHFDRQTSPQFSWFIISTKLYFMLQISWYLWIFRLVGEKKFMSGNLLSVYISQDKLLRW